jgi:hypothetical protein
VDDARVVLLFSKLSDRGGAVCGWPRVAARCRGGAKREVPVEMWGDGRRALPLRPHNNKAPGSRRGLGASWATKGFKENPGSPTQPKLELITMSKGRKKIGDKCSKQVDDRKHHIG